MTSRSRNIGLLAALILVSRLDAEDPAPASGRPPILVKADQDQVQTHVALHGFDAKPNQADFEAGLLTSTEPNLSAEPAITVTQVSAGAKASDYVVDLNIDAPMPFGESSAPLFYRGTQVDLLRFSRPGVSVAPATGTTFLAREDDPLLLVIDNHSAFGYEHVSARLRFQNQDFCGFDAEGATTATQAKPNQDCAHSRWPEFKMSQYTRMTLRATGLPTGWFRDVSGRYASSGKRTGILTLRFTSAANRVHEQDLPIEMQFEPGSWSTLVTLSQILLFLTMGAVLSLVLRVSLPNMKRKRALKDQLYDAQRSITNLSNGVSSRLRSLLNVDWLALNELRTEAFPVTPNYADFARRVEQGIPILSRKIAAVQRLGAAFDQRRARVAAGYEYSILQQAGVLLNAAARLVQKDQQSDDDWAAINKDIGAAEDLLAEPTQQARDAFITDLATRWQALQKHFPSPQAGVWSAPAAIADMSPFFTALPKEFCAATVDGFKQWAVTEGTAQADILVSALTLLRDVETLAAPGNASDSWKKQKAALPDIFVNITTQKLSEATTAMWMLSENIFKDEIEEALKTGRARLTVDPEIPEVNQRFRIAVCFMDDRLNTATARDQLNCRWTFETEMSAPRLRANRAANMVITHEEGWDAFHYFQNNTVKTKISVAFRNAGIEITPASGNAKDFPELTLTPAPNTRGKDKRARLLLEVAQLFAALLVPMTTLAFNTLSGGTEGQWWSLVALGFGTDTIKSILVGKDDAPAPSAK